MARPDASRFDDVVLPHLDEAYTLARYLVRNEHDAQDVVQEAALRAFRHLGGLRDADARAWLLTIVRNCCYSWLRRHRADRSTVSLTDDIELAGSRPADALAIESSEDERARAAVDALPPELREVVVLRELEEMSYREISEVAGIPMGTVMSRLSRARGRLAEMLGAREGD